MEPELKPCPFCGETNTAVFVNRNGCYVACYGCNTCGPEKLSLIEAKYAWDRRVGDDLREVSLRPKGRWIGEKCNHKPCRIKNPEKWLIFKCSICGYSNGRKQSSYCPNCGAKMEG